MLYCVARSGQLCSLAAHVLYQRAAANELKVTFIGTNQVMTQNRGVFVDAFLCADFTKLRLF